MLAVFTMINENLPSSNLASGEIFSKPPTEFVNQGRTSRHYQYTPSSYFKRILFGFTLGSISAPLAR